MPARRWGAGEWVGSGRVTSVSRFPVDSGLFAFLPVVSGVPRRSDNRRSAAEMLVLPDRIELSTSPLPRECSTTELRQLPLDFLGEPRSHTRCRTNPSPPKPAQPCRFGCYEASA